MIVTFGHLYGGVVSLLAAARRPAGICSLAVAEPRCFDIARGDPAVEEFVAAMDRLWTSRPREPRAFLKAFLAGVGSFVPTPDPLPPGLAQGARTLMVERSPQEVRIPLGELARAPFPKLVVSGAHHPAFDAVCDVLERALGAERAVLPGGGPRSPADSRLQRRARHVPRARVLLRSSLGRADISSVTLFVLAAVLLVVTALAGALSLRLGWTGTILAAYLLAAAELVVLAEALSPFHAVGRTGYLLGELVLLVAALAVWLRRGRPLLARPDLTWRSLRRHPVLVGLAVAVGAGLAFQAFLVAVAPPNNWDSMTYHLSRAAAWYQLGSVEWHPAPSARENVFPPNAEIEILWTIVLLGRDSLAALPQLVAELAAMTAIFGIGRRLGFGRAAALFPALLFATLSQVALQATTTQNDLVVAAAVATAAYFMLGRTRADLALAGVAVGLALGTKLTAVLALPVLALLALAVLPRRRLAELAAACACGFAALGAWGYVTNVAHDGSPLGDAEEISAFAPERTVPGTVATVARVLWRFVDLSGYEADIRVLVTLQNAGVLAFDSLHIEWSPPESTSTPFFVTPSTRAHEDISFFGPLGALLLVPLSLAFAVGGALGRVRREWLVLSLALPLFVLELALTYRYNAWLGRFLIVPVALTLPLAAWLYRWRLVAGGAAACGILFLGLALARNEAKPTPVSFGGAPAVWELDRTEAQALGRPELRRALRIVDSLPVRARVGYALGADAWIYPLYGPRLTRRLVQVDASDVLAAAERRGLRYVVVDRPVRMRAGWRATHDRQSRWTVLVRA